MARKTKVQINQQHDLLEYTVEQAFNRFNRFRKWRDEAAAKAYDLEEAVKVAEAQLDAANMELHKFCKANKL